MFDIKTILLFIAAFLNVLIGLVVLQRNAKKAVNIWFAGLVLAIAFWAFSIAGFLLSDSYETAFLWAKLFYFAPIVIAFSNFAFAQIFPRNQRIEPLFLTATGSLAVALAVALVLVPDFLVSDIVLSQAGNEVILNKLHYLLYSVYFVSYFYGALLLVYHKYRQETGIYRMQVALFLFGLLITSIFGVTFNLILPWLDNYKLIWFGPLFTVIFAVTTGYSIVKHHMFDIRLVIARSLAYAGTILTIGLIYGFGLFGFIDGFFPDTQTTTLQQAIYAFTAVFLAFTFLPLKKFFDKLTDRLFYRDRYDSETVLNALGKVYVSKSNSFELLDDSLKVLVDALKVEFGHLLVLDKNKAYAQVHYGGRKETIFDVKTFQGFDEQVTVYDELEEDNPRRRNLRASGVQVLVRLATQDGMIGYLLLGAKQSGAIYTQQDVNLLSIVAQDLAVAIQNAKSYAQIQAFSETLKEEVREATAKLRITNKRLRKLDAAKDEFISMASHQLRTPLTTIKGYISMLQDGDAGPVPKAQQEYLELALTGSEKMNNLIADMLNVSRISTGRLTIDKAPFDLEQVVVSEIDQLRNVAAARGVEVEFQPPRTKLPLLNLDSGKMRQVVMNFIDNAIYYTPKGDIKISLEQVDGNVEFKVKDNGIGIPREAQAQLFKKFFRAGNAQKVRPDGTGLGLYMAKQVVEAQGGQIIFHSVEGKGSTFGFRFRLDNT